MALEKTPFVCLLVKSEGRHCQNIPKLVTKNFLEVLILALKSKLCATILIT